jgi:hypothetical protein
LRQIMLGMAVVTAATAIGATSLVSPQAAPARERGTRAHQPDGSYTLSLIRRHRQETWRWQRLMRRPLTPSAGTARRAAASNYRRWVLELWARRVKSARKQAARPPRKRAWLCIQRHEASWHDAHGPYYGGLQMDLSFQRRYGFDLLRRKGTADNWTPLEQMWVAERAYRSGRGFYPWPNAARSCGLL